jgi:hypothetical protein
MTPSDVVWIYFATWRNPANERRAPHSAQGARPLILVGNQRRITLVSNDMCSEIGQLGSFRTFVVDLFRSRRVRS